MSTARSPMQESLDEISKKWEIPQEIYDLHMGRRDDVTERIIQVGEVYFHIPFLTMIQKYVLWKCLWPDCQNCCERPVRLPMTEDDIELMQNKLGYKTKSDFIKNETNMITFEDKFNKNMLITRTMLSMKRKKDETENDDGKKISCRFLTTRGCGIHPDKPGVCWLYPFHAWREPYHKWWKVEPHAKFVFTGDCPGFYLDASLDSMIKTLREYSKKINDHLYSYHRSERRGYISTMKYIKNYFPGNPKSTIVKL